MRSLLVVFTLLLAGCFGAADDAVTDDPAAEGSRDTASDGAMGSQADATPLLATLACDLEDRAVYTTGGVRTDLFGTSSVCTFDGLDVPDAVQSLRMNFTYTVAQSEGDFGIRLYHPDRCTQTSTGDECSIAEAFGSSPVVLDVDAATLGDYVLSELDAYAVGYGADTELDLEISFYSSEAPVGPA